MSYVTPQYAPPSGQPEKPSTVTIASLSLIGMAVLSFVSLILGIVSVSSLDAKLMEEIYTAAGADKATAEAASGFALAIMYVTVGVSAVFGIIYLILGIFVGKGKNWARITAWVFGGLAICCNGFGAIGGAASSSLGGGSNAGGLDAQLAQEKLTAAMPSWVTPVNLAVSVILLVLALVAVITLALPPSNGYFRKPEPEWVPPAGPAV